MSESADPNAPDLWDLWDLPPIEEMRNVDHDDDFYPSPKGKISAYYRANGHSILMRSLSGEMFSVGFDADPGEPHGLVFESPIPMFEDDETTGPAIRTLMTEDEIPIEERDHDHEHERSFIPTDDVAWNFEIVLETTAYEVGDGE